MTGWLKRVIESYPEGGLRPAVVDDDHKLKMYCVKLKMYVCLCLYNKVNQSLDIINVFIEM